MKNEREVIVLVPIKALLYETDEGETVCGRVAQPSMAYVLDCAIQGTNHPHVRALIYGGSK